MSSVPPLNLMSALAEGFQCEVDHQNRKIKAKTVDSNFTDPCEIQNVFLQRLSEITGSLWFLPTFRGIPFRCQKTNLWSEMNGDEITEDPPILRLEHATIVSTSNELPHGHFFAGPPEFRAMIIDGRTSVVETLERILPKDVIFTYILPYYSRLPEIAIDHIYFSPISSGPWRLSTRPYWRQTFPPMRPVWIESSVRGIRDEIARLKATPFTPPSLFGCEMLLPWIQFDTDYQRVMAHVTIGERSFLLVNHFLAKSVQKYPWVETVSEVQYYVESYKQLHLELFTCVTTLFDEMRFGYRIDGQKRISPLGGAHSAITQYYSTFCENRNDDFQIGRALSIAASSVAISSAVDNPLDEVMIEEV